MGRTLPGISRAPAAAVRSLRPGRRLSPGRRRMFVWFVAAVACSLAGTGSFLQVPHSQAVTVSNKGGEAKPGKAEKAGATKVCPKKNGKECGGFGQCDEKTGHCRCIKGYYGVDCTDDPLKYVAFDLDCAKMPQVYVAQCLKQTVTGSCTQQRLVWERLCFKTCTALAGVQCTLFFRRNWCSHAPECGGLCNDFMDTYCSTVFSDLQTIRQRSIDEILAAANGLEAEDKAYYSAQRNQTLTLEVDPDQDTMNKRQELHRIFEALGRKKAGKSEPRNWKAGSSSENPDLSVLGEKAGHQVVLKGGLGPKVGAVAGPDGGDRLFKGAGDESYLGDTVVAKPPKIVKPRENLLMSDKKAGVPVDEEWNIVHVRDAANKGRKAGAPVQGRGEETDGGAESTASAAAEGQPDSTGKPAAFDPLSKANQQEAMDEDDPDYFNFRELRSEQAVHSHIQSTMFAGIPQGRARKKGRALPKQSAATEFKFRQKTTSLHRVGTNVDQARLQQQLKSLMPPTNLNMARRNAAMIRKEASERIIDEKEAYAHIRNVGAAVSKTMLGSDGATPGLQYHPRYGARVDAMFHDIYTLNE